MIMIVDVQYVAKKYMYYTLENTVQTHKNV